MSDEYDVVKMDFPPYEEEYPALPEPEVTEEPFYKIKEEVYRRNRAIAAEQQTALLKEEERRKAEKREQFREMLEKSKSPAPALPKLRINGLALSIAVIAVFGIFIANVRKTKASADAAVSEAFASEVIQYMETERINYTQVVTSETSAAEQDSSKFTAAAVREPFEENGLYIYNTAAMSYMFAPSYDVIDGKTVLTLYVDVKNLTDYSYAVVPNFSIRNKGEFYAASVGSEAAAHFREAEELRNGEWVKTGAVFTAYDFNEKNICSFKLQFDSDVSEGTLYFEPLSLTSEEYAERSDEAFQIPLEDILA